MYLDPAFGLEEQWMITRMIYGAQSDSFDYHMVSANTAFIDFHIVIILPPFLFVFFIIFYYFFNL